MAPPPPLMPDLLDYEPARSTPRAHEHLVSRICVGILVLVLLTFAMSSLTVAWLRLTSTPSASLGMTVVILLVIALSSAKTAHLVVLLLQQRFPDLPIPFSVLPYLAAILFAFVLMVVCVVLFVVWSTYLVR